MTSALPRKMYVNLAVKDLERSIAFFKELGFAFDPQFTDPHASCMIVGDDAFVMLLDEKRFKDFARKPIVDTARGTEGIFAISTVSRAEVDELVNKAMQAGGKPAAEKQEDTFVYGRSFYDLDGHHWEVLYLDPQARQSSTALESEAQADS